MNQTATTTQPDARMLMDVCDSIGVRLSEPAFAKAIDRMRRTADVAGGITTSQVKAIVTEVISDSQAFEGVAESFR